MGQKTISCYCLFKCLFVSNIEKGQAYVNASRRRMLTEPSADGRCDGGGGGEGGYNEFVDLSR
jgi:hypothetical protein